MAKADQRYGTKRMLKKSLDEEEKAISDYGRRASETRSPAAKAAFEHNRAEEVEHAARLKRVMRYGKSDAGRSRQKE